MKLISDLSDLRDHLLPGLYGQSVQHGLQFDSALDYTTDKITFKVYNPKNKKSASFQLTKLDLVSGSYKDKFKPELDRIVQEVIDDRKD